MKNATITFDRKFIFSASYASYKDFQKKCKEAMKSWTAKDLLRAFTEQFNADWHIGDCFEDEILECNVECFEGSDNMISARFTFTITGFHKIYRGWGYVNLNTLEFTQDGENWKTSLHNVSVYELQKN